MSDKKTTLAEIQALVKAPKGNFNKFGNYKYRSAEDILEAVKLVINPLGFWVEITDEIVLIGDRFYVKANVTLTNGKEVYTTSAFPAILKLINQMVCTFYGCEFNTFFSLLQIF